MSKVKERSRDATRLAYGFGARLPTLNDRTDRSITCSARVHYDGDVPTRAHIITVSTFLVLVPVMTATDLSLEALDPTYVSDVLSRPPFVQISGVSNVRDLGSYPTSTPNLITKPGYAFRGAEVSNITQQGILVSILSSQPFWHPLMS